MDEIKTDEQLAHDSYLQAVRIKLQKRGLSPEAIESEVASLTGTPVMEEPAQADE